MTDLEAPLAPLQDALAYRFQDPSLLSLALSVLRPPLSPEAAAARQRLEFLGDAAWGLAVAEAVFQIWPQATAGDLTRFRSTWCSTSGLAQIARQIGLPAPEGSGPQMESDQAPAELPAPEVRPKASAVRAGPSDRVLAELLEAVLGAMVKDGGLEAVRTLAHRLIIQHGLATAPPVDPKSALQMLAQARYGALPTYRLLERRGPPHHPIFRVIVKVNGEGTEVMAEAEGTTRQAAEQEAARVVLQRLNPTPSP
jgi:ribonuclease-3